MTTNDLYLIYRHAFDGAALTSALVLIAAFLMLILFYLYKKDPLDRFKKKL